MKIGLITYDMQDFGGLEEYATSLAVGLQDQGHEVCMLSMAWVAPENQYVRRIKAHKIRLIQPPAWISKPASNWPTKEKILHIFMQVLTPVTFLLGLGLWIRTGRPLKQSWHSAHNWLKGQVMDHLIGPDYRSQLGRFLLNWWKLSWHPDIIHIQGYTTTLLFVIEWAHLHKVPVVYEEHQTPDPQFNWWKGFEASINKADRVIAVSEKSAQGLREVCKVTQPIVVRNPLLPDPYNSGWRKEEKLQSGKPLIITTVARLYVTKGLSHLLEAAARVCRTHPSVEFQVFGEGELRDELLAKASSLGLDGEKIFVGAFSDREELTRILSKTDIFLLPSILEGQPLALVEAMAHGCPIVATAVGGIPELIIDGVTGLLCRPGNPDCLTDKLMMLMDDLPLRRRLSNEARAAYEMSPFNLDAAAHHFISIYSTVLEERRSKALKQAMV